MGNIKSLDRWVIIKYNFLINYRNITEKIISEKRNNEIARIIRV